jgi:hypothetical protein
MKRGHPVLFRDTSVFMRMFPSAETIIGDLAFGRGAIAFAGRQSRIPREFTFAI